jgi:hypothetical protein
MNVLFSLISELDGYTLGHIQQKLESDNSKIFELFKLYKAARGKSPDDEKITKQLYGAKQKDMGVLYRLKNRLVHSINQALIELNTAEGKSTFLGEQHLILYRIFQSKGMMDLAEYYLLKSIKYAEANEQYSLLDIIYGEMISFCKDSLSEDPDLYIQKRRANFKMFNTLRTMDEILAVMTYRLKSTQNLSGQLNVTKEIDKTLRNFASDKEVFRSTQFKIKFYKTVSQILVQQQKFTELEKFILETRADFIKSGIFNKQTHDIKIEQLVYLTNALLFQRKFDAVIETGKLLYKEILDFDKLLYNKYIYFYYQAQINSYAVLDIDKAIELQAEVLEKGSIIKDAYFIVFNYANLAFLYFLKNNYKQTVKTLQKVYLNDYYPKIDISLKVELALLELMARYDLADVNTFEYRLAQVQTDLAGDWKDYDGIERKLLDIIVNMSTNPNYSKNKQIIELAKTYVQLSRNNTNRVFNFENWVIRQFGVTVN